MSTCLKRLGASAACLAAIGAHAYDRATIINMAPWPASVTVNYAACKHDSFTIPAATKDKSGTATAPTNRGGCLITSITASIVGKKYPVRSYTSSGTAYSEFMIYYEPPYVIRSRQEMGRVAWGGNMSNRNSPEGDFGYPIGSNPHADTERPH